MDDSEIEAKILEKLTEFGPMWSNKLFRKVGGNKSRFTRIREKMRDEKWIKADESGRNLLISISKFESSRFAEHDWTQTTRHNCNNYLKFLKENKPLFRVHPKKPFKIKKIQKMYLNAFFHELDRQMIVSIRLVNAEALGLIRSNMSKKYQKKCTEFVYEFIQKVLQDHKEFKDEIKEYAQSQVRTVQYKI